MLKTNELKKELVVGEVILHAALLSCKRSFICLFVGVLGGNY